MKKGDPRVAFFMALKYFPPTNENQLWELACLR
ncbi:hypothetical protein ACVWVZ_000529 [Pseudomonas tolaasii]